MKTKLFSITFALVICAGLLSPSGALAQALTTLHNFGTIPGSSPEAPLVQGPDGRLYGTAYYGGTYSNGTVFAVNPNGTGFAVLHTFSATATTESPSTYLNYYTNSDGANPEAGLTISSNVLYGTTRSGGANGTGTVFAMNIDGTEFTNLYSFTAEYYPGADANLTNIDGAKPVGGLALSGNMLYGTASADGADGAGTVFALNTSGGGFTVLHNFTQSDGAVPLAQLIISGNTLYGTASQGGTNYGGGTIFSLNIDGTGFNVLHNFAVDGGWTNSDGGTPAAGVILSGDTLYGTASTGGVNGKGTVFKVKTDGSGFTVLHAFPAVSWPPTNSDGASPQANLCLSGDTLYGVAEAGGTGGAGSAFSIHTDGSGFTELHGFTGSDGSQPLGGLVLLRNTLFGTTSSGGGGTPGTAYGAGTIFTVQTNGIGFKTQFTFYPNLVNFDGINLSANLTLSTNILYGVANGGAGVGTLFAVNTDGSDFNILHQFTGADASGPQTGNHGFVPFAPLVLSGNTLYGTVSNGGTNGNGSIFKINTDGSGFAVLYNFTAWSYNSINIATNADGIGPNGLVLFGNTLYGAADSGGPRGAGTIFAVNTNGTGFTRLHDFESFVYIGNDGDSPNPGLILSGNRLYGTTEWGGGEFGTVFSLNTNGTEFTTLHSFSGIDSEYGDTNSDGANPYVGLTLSGDTLYGTTSTGGANGEGTVFKVNIDGSGFTVLHAFSAIPWANTNSDGASPQASLCLYDGSLYGTTRYGGTSGSGTVFAVNTNGSDFTTIHSFTTKNFYYELNDGYTVFYRNDDGAWPESGLALAGSTFYGTTSVGGLNGGGTAFSLLVSPMTNQPVSFQTLVVAPAPYSQAMGISGGNIVGCSFYENSDDTGFLYNGSLYSSFVVPNAVGFSGSAGASGPDGFLFGGTFPAGISGGSIVGYYTDTNANVHGFLYSGGVFTTLDEPNAQGWTYAQGIDNGNIVGSYQGADSVYHGFLYNGGVYTTLNDPNAHGSTFASGISGEDIVGWYNDSNSYPHGFLYNGSSYVTLDEPNAVGGTYACGISDGAVVGYYFGQDGTAHGFLYYDRNYTTLDIPGAGASAFQGTYVHGISGNTVVGWYLNGDSAYGFTATVVLPTSNQLSISGISLSGANLVLNGLNGVSGTTNYVLTSTNLALPLSDWTRASTNVLSSTGNFIITITNTVAPSVPQRFYILQSP